MRVLLDECLPRGLKPHLSRHTVTTVQEAGWSGSKNGALLRLAEGKFDAFVTVDSNLEYQQNLTSFSFGVVIVTGRRSRLPDLLPAVPAILDALESIRPGEVVKIV